MLLQESIRSKIVKIYSKSFEIHKEIIRAVSIKIILQWPELTSTDPTLYHHSIPEIEIQSCPMPLTHHLPMAQVITFTIQVYSTGNSRLQLHCGNGNISLEHLLLTCHSNLRWLTVRVTSILHTTCIYTGCVNLNTANHQRAGVKRRSIKQHLNFYCHATYISGVHTDNFLCVR